MISARLGLAVLLAAAALAALAVPRATASGDCRSVAGGPFLYADLVIPDSYVECSSAQNRIRIWVELSRDGVVVASERRDCRKVAVCHLDVGVATDDPPGDQQWCVRVRGEVAGRAVPEATSCESEAF
jgi:hypothetical protein